MESLTRLKYSDLVKQISLDTNTSEDVVKIIIKDLSNKIIQHLKLTDRECEKSISLPFLGVIESRRMKSNIPRPDGVYIKLKINPKNKKIIKNCDE